MIARSTRLALPLVAATALAVALSGCQRAETCVDWVHFEDSAALAEAADLVVRAKTLERDGTVELYGADAETWQLEVDVVEKGDAEPGPLRVAITPATCDGGGGPDTPAVETGESYLLYLTDSETPDGIWRTLTAYQGVELEIPDEEPPAP